MTETIPHGSTEQNGQTPPRPRIRWKAGLAILVAGALLQWLAWTKAPDRTFQVGSVYFLGIVTALCLLLWWLFWSGCSRKVRLIGVCVPATLVGLFFLLFRLDGFWGDFRPRISWRWSSTDEDTAAAFWNQQASNGNSGQLTLPDRSANADAGPDRLEISDQDWPQFLGPRRDAIVRSTDIRRDWDRRPPERLWKHPAGPAWSSFAVVGNVAFTQEQRGPDEAVVCYDLETGQQQWVHTDSARYETVRGGVGPRATPTFFGSRLYTLGGTGILNCLDPLTGDVFWSTNILEDAGVSPEVAVEEIPWGMAGSPLIVDGMVVVNPGVDPSGGTESAVAAYDRLTGHRVWASGRFQASYLRPRVAVVDGVRQILIFDAAGLAGHDIQSGLELWRSPEWGNVYNINVAQPLVLDDNRILVSAGYGTGTALFHVAQDDDWMCGFTGWKTSNRLKLKFNDAVLKDGYLYGLDEGILACFDPQTGRRKWKRGRYGYGQLLLLHDVLFVLTESGEAVLVDASPERFRERTRFSVLDSDDQPTWNHPVIVRDRLVVRNATQMACYDVGEESSDE